MRRDPIINGLPRKGRVWVVVWGLPSCKFSSTTEVTLVKNLLTSPVFDLSSFNSFTFITHVLWKDSSNLLFLPFFCRYTVLKPHTHTQNKKNFLKRRIIYCVLKHFVKLFLFLIFVIQMLTGNLMMDSLMLSMVKNLWMICLLNTILEVLNKKIKNTLCYRVYPVLSLSIPTLRLNLLQRREIRY